MDRYGTERRIVEILNRAYGDNATSPLDRVAAREIMQELVNVGWASGEEIAYLVEAAGGEIRIPDNLLTEPAPRLLQFRSDLNDEIVFQTKSEELRNPSPAERESGEARVVQSGPIKVKATKQNDDDGYADFDGDKRYRDADGNPDPEA